MTSAPKEAVRVDLSPSSAELLKLRKGDVVYVQPPGCPPHLGGPVRMRLLAGPELAAIGKPGPRRIRFDLLDIEHAARTDRWEERQGPGYRGRVAGVPHPARHTVSGDRVRGVERSS